MADTVKTSSRVIDNAVRAQVAGFLAKALSDSGEDVGFVGNGMFNVLMVDANGNETVAVVEVKIPKGERVEGGGYAGYDPFDAREAYAEKVKADAEKAAAKKVETEAKKAKKTMKAESPEALPHEIAE